MSFAPDLSDYHTVIARKKIAFKPRGFDDVRDRDIPDSLFDHQKHGVDFALRTGSSAMFYDTGLGKTAMSLAWGDAVVRRTNKPVLMLAPLAVGPQHVKEAERLGIDATTSRFGNPPPSPKITVTNYDRLDRFDPDHYAGVILDESSILKSFTGVTTRKLIEAFNRTPFRLACSATPAPNDHMELGQHSDFLGVMHANEMLTRWFIADQSNMGRYRLKRSAVTAFWDWVASWARCVSKPSDLGFSDVGFEMPELFTHRHIVEADRTIDRGEEKDGQGRLFRLPDMSATSIHKEKRLTAERRAAVVGDLVNAERDEPWIIWCDTDYEADALKEALPSAIEVRGSMSIDVKEDKLATFTDGRARHLITKPSIAGYGLNWQHCARVAFAGLSFSYESYYQAVRRCWRFRQARPVHSHIVCADTEASIWDVISRKAGDHDAMKIAMSAAMRRACQAASVLQSYQPEIEAVLPEWMQ